MLVSAFSSYSLSALLFYFLLIHAHTSLYEANTEENRVTTRQASATALSKQWAETTDLLLKHGIEMAHVTKDRIYSGSRSNENMQEFWSCWLIRKQLWPRMGTDRFQLSSTGWVWSIPMLMSDSTLPEGIFPALLWVMAVLQQDTSVTWETQFVSIPYNAVFKGCPQGSFRVCTLQ